MTCPVHFELGMRVKLTRYWTGSEDAEQYPSVPYYRATGTIVKLESDAYALVRVDPEFEGYPFHNGSGFFPSGSQVAYYLHTWQCDIIGPAKPKKRPKSGFGKFSKSIEERFGV